MSAMKRFAAEEIEREIRLDEQKDYAEFFEQLYTALNSISKVREWLDSAPYIPAEDIDAERIFDDLRKVEIQTRGSMERLDRITDPDNLGKGVI